MGGHRHCLSGSKVALLPYYASNATLLTFGSAPCGHYGRIMRALVLADFWKLTVDDVPEPEPGPGDVLI
jgi:hypothetical protein